MLLQKTTPKTKTVYDIEMLQLIGLFEKITHAQVKDVFYFKEILTFVIFEGDMPKALGRDNSNLQKVEALLKRRIKIVEYSSNMIKFITNLLYPYRVKSITQDGKTIIISDQDTKTKGLIIGAKAQNLRQYESIVKKYFDIDEIKVV
jgi:transcription termination/antitermination protein NusA